MFDWGRISSTILILLIASSFTAKAQPQYDNKYKSIQDTVDQYYDSIMVDTMIRYFYTTVNDSIPDSKIFNIYNADGQVIWHFIYEGEPCILVRNDFSYDTFGNLLEKNRYKYPFSSPSTALDTIKMVSGRFLTCGGWLHDV